LRNIHQTLYDLLLSEYREFRIAKSLENSFLNRDKVVVRMSI